LLIGIKIAKEPKILSNDKTDFSTTPSVLLFLGLQDIIIDIHAANAAPADDENFIFKIGKRYKLESRVLICPF